MVSCGDFLKIAFEVCLPIVADHSAAYISHAISSIVYILSNHVSDSRNIPSLKLSATFCRVLFVIFWYTVGTRISTIVASLDFTSRSTDYVLIKAGLLSTTYFTRSKAMNQQYTKSPFFISFSCNHVIDFCARSHLATGVNYG